MQKDIVPGTAPTTQAGTACGQDPLVVTLDVGSSSVRTMLFDGQAREVEGLGAQFGYEIQSTSDGGMEVDALWLADLASKALSVLHSQMQARNLRASAVGCCTFWHNVLGVGGDATPVTPVLHPFDTRAAAAAAELGRRVDGPAQHSRTGCVLHASYLPAKLLWLSTANPQVFNSARQWMSFGEFLYLGLFGRSMASTSMVSGSGLWDQNRNDYDDEILSVLPINRAQLAPPGEMDQPLRSLK
ncbi:MAG: hypothetical protein KGM47_16255, partial [Acidobacteriota bacterium]|nr:hypothetical protein [Acidobacteriota bacterium]